MAYRRHYSFMRTEMEDHWKVYYEWLDIDPVRLAKRYHSTPKQVEEMMQRIEKANPNPKEV